MADDLSAQSQPLGGFLAQPPTTMGEAQCRLTEKQLGFYQEHGYVAGVRILTDRQLDQLREELAALADPSRPVNQLFYEYHSNESTDPKRVLFHALGAWRIGAGFHDLLWHPAFTMPASQLVGGPVRFWHDQLFCKPAFHGGVVAWHQDYSYWTRTTPMAHLTCWIGLDDATTENGCLHYIPGSHQWDLLPITGLGGDMDAVREVLNDQQWEVFQHPVPVELRAGEATFHHPLTIHGSFENTSPRLRRATVVNVFADGTQSDADEPLLEGVPVIAKGERMEGQFFPLLFDPGAGS